MSIGKLLQGMAFFYLDSDLLIPVEVSAHGYKDFFSRISVASNTTYLVEASLCKLVAIISGGYQMTML